MDERISGYEAGLMQVVHCLKLIEIGFMTVITAYVGYCITYQRGKKCPREMVGLNVLGGNVRGNVGGYVRIPYTDTDIPQILS